MQHKVGCGAKLVVSQSARTLFSLRTSEDSEQKTQASEPAACSPTDRMRKTSCRTLRKSPDKKFVSYHKFPPLNYSCAAIIFYILFDSRESVGVKTVLWSWGNVGRRLRRRVKKLAVARPSCDCSFSLSSNRVGQQFLDDLSATSVQENKQKEDKSVGYRVFIILFNSDILKSTRQWLLYFHYLQYAHTLCSNAAICGFRDDYLLLSCAEQCCGVRRVKSCWMHRKCLSIWDAVQHWAILSEPIVKNP